MIISSSSSTEKIPPPSNLQIAMMSFKEGHLWNFEPCFKSHEKSHVNGIDNVLFEFFVCVLLCLFRALLDSESCYIICGHQNCFFIIIFILKISSLNVPFA
jgi:hypothetical protein